MILTAALFFVGFGLLIKGADYFVSAAASIARKYGISAIVIGLTIVAFGTSAPELAVNVLASLSGSTGIAIGNVLGSNIANILLILGITAAIAPIRALPNTVHKEIPFSFFAALLVLFLANDVRIDGAITDALTRIDGLVLLSFFAIFMYYIVTIAKVESEHEATDVMQTQSLAITFFILLASLGALVLGGAWVVQGAVVFATYLGISETIIGLTVVAIGTSLPELVTSVVAARKGETDIAIGNIVGSNIFNIFWILGVSAVIAPLPFSSTLDGDIILAIVASLILFATMYVGKRHLIERWQGIAMVVVYCIYIVYLVLKV